MNVFVVMPAYNEAARIDIILKSLAATGYCVVVVDDGSTDETRMVAAQYPVTLLSHLVNLGQGAALRTGTDYAKQAGADIIVHCDADGQHRIEDVQTLVATLAAQTELDIVLGSRFLGVPSILPWQKRIILLLAKMFSRLILKLQFTDPQNGLRVFRAAVLEKLDWRANDFLHCSEILGLIIKCGLRYREIPIKVNYHQSAGSKLTRPRVSMGWRLLLDKLLG